MSIGETIYNITHANKIARERDKAIKNARRAVMIGVTSVAGVSISSYVMSKQWKEDFEKRVREHDEAMKKEIEMISLKLKEYQPNFEDEGGDNNGC